MVAQALRNIAQANQQAEADNDAPAAQVKVAPDRDRHLQAKESLNGAHERKVKAAVAAMHANGKEPVVVADIASAKTPVRVKSVLM